MPTFAYQCKKCKNMQDLFLYNEEWPKSIPCKECGGECIRRFDKVRIINKKKKQKKKEIVNPDVKIELATEIPKELTKEIDAKLAEEQKKNAEAHAEDIKNMAINEAIYLCNDCGENFTHPRLADKSFPEKPECFHCGSKDTRRDWKKQNTGGIIKGYSYKNAYSSTGDADGGEKQKMRDKAGDMV